MPPHFFISHYTVNNTIFFATVKKLFWGQIISGSLLRGEFVQTKFQFSTGVYQGCSDLIIEINSIKGSPKLEQLLIRRKVRMDGLRNRIGRFEGSKKMSNGKNQGSQEKGERRVVVKSQPLPDFRLTRAGRDIIIT